jgi:hypothetical protein
MYIFLLVRIIMPVASNKVNYSTGHEGRVKRSDQADRITDSGRHLDRARLELHLRKM